MMVAKILEQHDLVVTAAASGMRLDRFLVVQLPTYSRTRLQALMAQGCLQKGPGAFHDGAYKVKEGERYRLTVPEAEALPLIAQAIPLEIVYEDLAILVVNKPAGLVVHPAPGHHADTLVHALLAHCGDTLSGIGGVKRPGIVHRLDKDTSGLMVVAKNDAAHHHLAHQFAERTLKRRYLALAWGLLLTPQGLVEGNLGRSSHNRQKMAVVKKGGKPAQTFYQVKETFTAAAKDTISLLECTLATGRTHQIRVHLAFRGHPLVGDRLYGRKRHPGAWPAAVYNFPRQALHAFALEFYHPCSKELLTFTVPLPADIEEFLITLRRFMAISDPRSSP